MGFVKRVNGLGVVFLADIDPLGKRAQGLENAEFTQLSAWLVE